MASSNYHIPPLQREGLHRFQTALTAANQISYRKEKEMKRFLAVAAITMVAGVAWATSLSEKSRRQIVGLTPGEVRWFTPPYYNDGRQRARLFGNSSEGGAWIDRVKIPGGARVLA